MNLISKLSQELNEMDNLPGKEKKKRPHNRFGGYTLTWTETVFYQAEGG